MQGLTMEVDLSVLPRKEPDIVLGIQWLQNLGKVTHDYLNQTTEFSWSGRDYALKGEKQVVNLPNDEHEGQPVEQPLAICDTRIILQKGTPVRQVLMQWSGRPPEEATREWLSKFQEIYPSYHLEDKVISEREKNVTASPREPRLDGIRRNSPRSSKRDSRVAVQFDNACTTKDDLKKAYEKCNDIPQESRALIDTFLKEEPDKDYEMNLSMYGNAAKIVKQLETKYVWL
ncbi:hypothetical protein Tco_1091412 [Tanacetum coccineum]|uniref:Uncharacterized protein n=1 Tax=Tanacetum coccineum TaxID=301880 RepID=A0ABQ5I860_9ASTR